MYVLLLSFLHSFFPGALLPKIVIESSQNGNSFLVAEVRFDVDQRLPGDRDAVPVVPVPQPRRRIRSALHVKRVPVGARCYALSLQTRFGVQLGNYVAC